MAEEHVRNLEQKVAALERAVATLRTTVQGEYGDNGIKASAERAHAAIKETKKDLHALQAETATLKQLSIEGDYDMKDKLLGRIETVEHDLAAKLDAQKEYQNRMLVAILLGVIGSIIVPVVL